jgi:hypothetical protein
MREEHGSNKHGRQGRRDGGRRTGVGEELTSLSSAEEKGEGKFQIFKARPFQPLSAHLETPSDVDTSIANPSSWSTATDASTTPPIPALS